jgi:pSer/pThr/pTyr-binding forkhead associated (FHA) protein
MEERCWKESSNGTYVNSTEATMAGVKVNNGDIITAGDIKLVFEIY